MEEIKVSNFHKYRSDIVDLIKYFDESSERVEVIVDNLESFIRDGSAFAAGHVIDKRLESFIWCYKRLFNNSERIHISYFIVNSKFRGKGLSRELFKYAQKIAEKHDINFIDLNVDPSNENALAVYNKFGFEIEKIQLRYQKEKK